MQDKELSDDKGNGAEAEAKTAAATQHRYAMRGKCPLTKLLGGQCGCGFCMLTLIIRENLWW